MGFEYSRTKNPTRSALEKSIAMLENGKFAICYSSGMGAADAIIKLLEILEVQSILNSSNGQFAFSNDAQTLTGTTVPEKFYRLYYLEKTPELTGGVVDKARADLGTIGSGSAGQAIVSLSMNSDGSKTWARVTGANVGQRIAIVLDNKVHMAPSIREKIAGGRTQIEGFGSMNEAKDLAIILRAGALPAPVNITAREE